MEMRRLSLILLTLVLSLTLSLQAYTVKTRRLTYFREGVELEYLLYTSEEGNLYCRDLSGTWENNPLWIWNYVDDFWADVGKFGIVVVYEAMGNVRWVIIHPTKGIKLWGGYLIRESWQRGKLKNVSFELKDKGGYITLTFLDEALGELKHYKYWIDIWGRHDLIESDEG